MAECIVEVCRIEKVFPHPNADLLELAQIKGWQCIVPKGRYQSGELVTYIPIDSMIPLEHADRWGFTKYLTVSQSAEALQPGKGRVRCAKLRGEPSFGVIVEVENAAWQEGQNVREHYGIEKYLPPLKPTGGAEEKPHPLFVEYTEVENLRNFPGLLHEGEEVLVTEKIHGGNARAGMVEGELMAGSHSVRRRRPESEEAWSANLYWFPLTQPGVRPLLESLGAQHHQVILFGEVFGKVQALHYGHRGRLGFRAFDLMVDGKYLSADAFLAACAEFGVETVPVLYRGPYSLARMVELSRGNTTLPDNHIREGVVVKPVEERTDPVVGRVVLKYIGDQYLFSKAADQDSRDV